jgi:16S rRNA processing protein RimM
MDEIAPGYVAVGRVLSPWGLRGDLKVEPLAEQPELAPNARVNVGGEERVIERSRRGGRLLYVKLSGIDDRDAAEALRGRYLQVPESSLEPLEPGRYYRFQLIGLTVRSTDGEVLGRVSRVDAQPANDVFVVQGPLGEFLVPAVDEIVRDIDVKGRTMTIEVVPGLLPPRRGR